MTNTKSLKMLLVDDDKFLLDMYVLKFQKAGMQVDAMSSTSSALEKIRTGAKYDIILSDIIMPGMDGIELVQTLRTEKLCSDTCLIMLTNEQNRADVAQKLSVDGYVIKATSVPSEVVEKVLSIYKNKNS